MQSLRLQKSTGTGKHSLQDRGDDCYWTPEIAIESLVKRELLTRSIVWEPCCGSGNIVNYLRNLGKTVVASDIHDHGCPDSESGVDFLKTTERKADLLVTNPPFKLAAEFVRHALRLEVPQIYMLLRLAFLESTGRSDILDGHKPSRVLVFKRRLPMSHRLGWTGPKASSAVCFAWFSWSSMYRDGPTVIERI